MLYNKWFDSLHKNACLHTAHEVINHGVDGAVEVAQPVRDERRCDRVIILRQFDCISVQRRNIHKCLVPLESRRLIMAMRNSMTRQLMELSGESR